MDRVKKGALEAVAKHQADRRAGKEQELKDPLEYWVEMQIPATSVNFILEVNCAICLHFSMESIE